MSAMSAFERAFEQSTALVKRGSGICPVDAEGNGELMSSVLFYEKPGCLSNAKQKALLTALGVTLAADQDLQSCSRSGPDPRCDLPTEGAAA